MQRKARWIRILTLTRLEGGPTSNPMGEALWGTRTRWGDMHASLPIGLWAAVARHESASGAGALSGLEADVRRSWKTRQMRRVEVILTRRWRKTMLEPLQVRAC